MNPVAADERPVRLHVCDLGGDEYAVTADGGRLLRMEGDEALGLADELTIVVEQSRRRGRDGQA